MNDSAQATLFHPFVADLLDMPRAGERALLLNAPAGLSLPEGLEATLSAVQDFRPAFLALQRAGFQVTPAPEGEGYDLGLVLCGRHRRQNEDWVAEVLQRTRPGGRILVAGARTDGIASLCKAVGALLPIEGRAAKYHGTAFWLERPEDAGPAIAALRSATGEQPQGGFVAGAGLFSAGHADPGSLLLAGCLPRGFKGEAADFGAGWGYLSVKLAGASPELARIDLYEASHAACRAAERNMARLAPQVSAETHWHDLLSEPVPRRYDLVVMNPPFHQGRSAEPALGIGMIAAAAAALKPKGRLLMVANRHLPYERALGRHFGSSRQLLVEAGYKIIEAVR